MATLSAVKFGMDPQKAALLTAGAGALGFAAAAKYKRPGWEQVAIGVGAGGACLAALPYVTNLAHGSGKPAAPATAAVPHRQADGEYVTRTELNEAVTRLAEQQKQANCDTLDAIRQELRRSLVAGDHKAANDNRRPATGGDAAPRRRAEDEVLNPYGRNDGERDADERDADERDADAEFWRDAEGERDADPDAWRDADERDVDPDEWRDAGPDDWRNNDERDAAFDEQAA
jgi:hypothetical protein